MARQRRIPRCHVEAALEIGVELTLARGVSHHLLTVLRAAPGDTLELFNSDGLNYAAELVETGKRARVIVQAVSINHAESPLHTTLLQGISRGDRMDTTIQKCVELGLSRLCPIHTRRSIAPLDDKRTLRKLEHWRSIAISACEQSGRSRVPVIDAPVSLQAWLSSSTRDAEATFDTDDGADCPTAADDDDRPGMTQQQAKGPTTASLRCVLAPGAALSLPAACRHYRTAIGNDDPLTRQDVTMLVGPESGLDTDELALAERHGFSPVRLGPRILRTETAGLAAMTVLQAFCGDLDDELPG